MRTLKAALLGAVLALASARSASDCEKAAPASLSRALREQLCSGSTGAGLLGVSLSSRAYLSKPLASRSPHALPSAARAHSAGDVSGAEGRGGEGVWGGAVEGRGSRRDEAVTGVRESAALGRAWGLREARGLER